MRSARWRSRTHAGWPGCEQAAAGDRRSRRRLRLARRRRAGADGRRTAAPPRAVALLRRARRVRRAWKEAGQTIRTSSAIRHEEAERAAAALGADFRCLDLGDYPLEVEGDALARLTDAIRELAPDVIVTHTDRDPFNPDHPVAFAAVERARALAAGAGVESAFETIQPPQLLLFEPHQPELCNFMPTTFVDITPVMERKLAAMAEMKAQSYLQTYYGQRAEQRANHARRVSGDKEIRYAEAFMRVLPQVLTRAVSRPFDDLAGSGPRRSTRRPAARDWSTSTSALCCWAPRRRPGAHRAVRSGRQPDGARRDGPRPARRRARADHARARAGRADRRAARHAGQGARRGGAAGRRRGARRRGPARAGPADLGALDPRQGRREDGRRARSTSPWRWAAPRSARATRWCSTSTGSWSWPASASTRC